MDSLVRNLTIVHEDGYGYQYEDLCARTIVGTCVQNDVLAIGKYMDEIESLQMNVTYPIWFDPETFTRVTFNFFVGGVQLNSEDSTLKSIDILALNYFLNSATDVDVKM